MKSRNKELAKAIGISCAALAAVVVYYSVKIAAASAPALAPTPES